MYAKVISKIRCYSPNSRNTPIRNYNSLYYIATREGVDLTPDHSDPSDNETYMRYIHERPRSHGLFGNIDTHDINAVCTTVRHISESCCIYRGILSLSEPDAKELGFMEKTAWKDFLTLSLPDIAETLGIPTTEMVWIAAFHKEKGHPHVHYMLWDNNPDHIQTPFISVPQQHKCREIFSGRFFAAEKSVLSLEKTSTRDAVIAGTKSELQNSLQKLVADICNQPSFKTLNRVNRQFLDTSSLELLNIVEHLPQTGSTKYAYLSPDLKNEINQFVEKIVSKPELKEEYDSYLNYHARIAKTYTPTKNELRISLLKAKEDLDRRLANAVINAAKSLREEKDIYYALQNHELPSYQQLLKTDISSSTFENLQTEIEKGDYKAAYILGRIYDDKNSCHHDSTKAMYYYKMAADNGDISAKGILGSKYLWGKDVKRNESLGRLYLHEAQENGSDYAYNSENAYDTYQKECVDYTAVSLMTNLLNMLCTVNQTRCPSSVYRTSIDKNSKKAKQELAKQYAEQHRDDKTR